ncbi:MAG TPA: Smr/MutS family protein [Thermoanaerobaculia bacterium]|nr:Smr/MutS family protein [Thermoanaerobaculia bacterium]
MNDEVLSPATAAALEWPSLLALVSELAASDLGRERIAALAPYAGDADLAAARRRYEEADRLATEGRLVPSFEQPLGELLERLETGRPPLTGGDLVRLAALLRATGSAAKRVRAADPPCSELGEIVAELPDLSELVREVDARLDRRGDVRDDASNELVALRRRIRGVRDQLYRDLTGFVSEQSDHLGEDTIPMRGGRLMVMLDSGARGRVQGLTHGRSGSGKSFYFEPLGVVEQNNTLQQATEDEEAERARILNELLAAARDHLEAIHQHAELLAELDLLEASRAFAELSGGRLADVAPRGELVLVRARHPLLDPRLSDLRRRALGQPGHAGDVVPLDLTLGDDSRALVVTGPNAGGKTVALKTVGLLTVAAQCALPVPAAKGSRLPQVAHLVATVGDEQDLLTDRSTFSGRLLRLEEAWKAAGPDSLILLDELGSGTDPEEGSALATALVEALVARQSLAVITTHLTQVAAAALELDGASCAAMEFDPAGGEPTFHLLPGPPGGSEALALARRLGLAEEWLDRAESLLGSGHRELQRLLTEVESLRGELAAEKERVRVEADDAEKLRRRLADEQQALAEERKNVGKKLRAQLDAFRRETLDKLRDEVEAMRGEMKEGRKKGVAAKAVGRLFEAAPEIEEVAPEPQGELEEGATVHHRGLGWEGRLVKLDRGRAEVDVRGKTFRCKADELIPVAGSASKPKQAKRKVTVDTADDGAPVELMLIGKRVEPALNELDDYLDRALLGSRPEVRVVHGHGSGALRDAVREHLRHHPAVANHRPGKRNEGGDGATVVTLRG